VTVVNRTLFPILTIGIIVLAAVAGMMYWSSVNGPKRSAGVVDGGDRIGSVRIENSTGGNWTISFTGGSAALKNVHVLITNPSTGERTVDKPISALVPAKNDPDAVFNDRDENNRIDAGDTLLLNGSSPNVLSGYKVQFLKGDNVLAVIKEIP